MALSLLKLPAELRDMIWREVLCPSGSVLLDIDYESLNKEVRHEIKRGGPNPRRRYVSDEECLLVRRAVRTKASMSVLQVNRAMHNECSSVLRKVKDFNLVIDMSHMFWFGWTYLGWFLSTNKVRRIDSVTIMNIKRPRNWLPNQALFWGLTECLIPVLLEGAFHNLRLSYNKQDMLIGDDGNVLGPSVFVPLDDDDYPEIDAVRNRGKAQLNFKLRREEDSESSTNFGITRLAK